MEESVLRGLEQISRGVTQMTNGTDRAIAPPAIDCRFIQTAQRRVEAMRSNKGDFLEPPVLSDLEQALEQRVQKCEFCAG